MAQDNNLFEKVAKQVKKNTDDIKRVENDQVEMIVNIVLLLLLQVLLFRLFVI